MTFYGLAQTIFKSYIKILLLVKKIIVFWCLGLHLDEKDSVITLDQTNYSENLKPIASNMIMRVIWKIYYNHKYEMDEWPNKARYWFWSLPISVDKFLWSGTNYTSKLHKNFVIGKENNCFLMSRFTPRWKRFCNYLRPDELFRKLETNSF